MKWDIKLETQTRLRLDGTLLEGFELSWRKPGTRKWSKTFIVPGKSFSILEDLGAVITKIEETL